MEKNNLPYASIIVPVHNSEKITGECIESLLKQTYPKDKYEIIVVDNNSKDRTAEIIKKYPVKYLLEDKIQSSYAARNTGVKVAKGEILVFTDGDCRAEGTWLFNLVTNWNGNWGGVAGDVLELPARSFAEKFQVGTFDQERSLIKSAHPFAPTANVAYKKQVFDEIGFFREDLVSGGDADFSWRVIRHRYSIKFRKDARIFHKNRTTLLGIYKQAKRYAFGAACLSLDYSHLLESRKSLLIKLFMKFLQLILIIPYRTLTFLFKKEKIYYLLEPSFMIVETWGYIRGELLGRDYIKDKENIVCPYE